MQHCRSTNFSIYDALFLQNETPTEHFALVYYDCVILWALRLTIAMSVILIQYRTSRKILGAESWHQLDSLLHQTCMD